MSEVQVFREVDDFYSALSFACRYIDRRLQNLLTLRQCNKFDDFMNEFRWKYGLPTVSFQKIFKDLSSVLTTLLDCQVWEVTTEEMLHNLEDLAFEHILFGLEKHFPDQIRKRIELCMCVLKTKNERMSELISYELDCIDRFL